MAKNQTQRRRPVTALKGLKKSLAHTTVNIDKLRVKYGVDDPGQIQMKILWFHIKQLVKATYPNEGTEALLKKYDQEWMICDAARKIEYGTES